MKAISLGHLGLSLIGCYALVEALNSFPVLATSSISLLHSGVGGGVVVAVTVLPFAVLIWLGLVLMTKPDRVANALWRRDVELPPVADELAPVLFAAAGAIIFAGALPSLIHGAIIALTGSNDIRYQTFVGALARASLGVVLFFRPRAVLDLWRREQPGGRAQ